MRKTLVLLLCIAIAPALFPVSGLAQNGKIEADIQKAMKEHNIIGVSTAVVKKGKIIYVHSFGLKDVESNTPLSDQDIFRIASISKSFSATSIMQLVEAGKLSLDDDFSKLVGFTVRNPKYPDIPITLKMVLSHRSSINDSQGYFTFDVINPAKNPDYAKCYNDYAPGQGYQYCNLNFNMVGAVIERASGERFDNYVKRHILDPLGLYGGYCVDSLDSRLFVTLYDYDSATQKLVAQPMAYAPRREEIKNYVLGYSTPVFSPTGGMKISATGLATYMIMHMNHGEYHGVRIISTKRSKLMQKKISEEEGYGLAITNVTNMIYGQQLTGHTGSAYGLHSAMFFNRKKHYGIVAIINGCDPTELDGFTTAQRAVMRALYEDVVK
ncbi:MAG TPA: serine hydrolase [Puia sp.]|nr:serine hydrolase [Puia sp.]